jgi:hypothetical protein
MNMLWSYTGMPAISLPLLQSEEGLPIGVQLVGARHDDARLLRTARWLLENFDEITGELIHETSACDYLDGATGGFFIALYLENQRKPSASVIDFWGSVGDL